MISVMIFIRITNSILICQKTDTGPVCLNNCPILSGLVRFAMLSASQGAVQCRYILFSVLFQTKSSLVWKSYTQKLRTIFQTNSSLVWKDKN